MKGLTFLLFSLTTIFINIAAYKGYYDCTNDDCSFYDFPDDPRNPFMNLWLQVESGLNSTLSLPNWKKGFEFYDGYLEININEFSDECACPVISKEDKTFVTFHSRDILDLWYSYKFPFSADKDGDVQITCEYTLSALLMNQKNHAPSFQNVEVSSLYIFNFVPSGIPLEWMDNLPGKYKKVIEKAMYKPVQKLLEDTLLQAFNEELKKLYSTQSHGVHDISVH